MNDHLDFLKGKKVLVACSGGLDSVVLSHLMLKGGYEMGIAHCNFKLRGKESDDDEEFVNHFAEQSGVPFYAESFETEKYAAENGISVQMAARELRYQWFEEIRKDFDYDYILTAHHADDSLETLLINLSRGTGLRGLMGIPEQNKYVVRPLLPFSRIQILEYAKSYNLFWREDSSNDKDDYLRNYLRHNVIPEMKEGNSSLLTNVRKTQDFLKDTELLINDYLVLIRKLVMTESKDELHIDVEKLQELPNTDALLYELLRPFNFTAWDDISELIHAQSGKQIFSKTHRLLKDRKRLILTETQQNKADEEYALGASVAEIRHPIHIDIASAEHFEITNAHTVFLDRELLKFPLTIRKWREGDSFYPFGMKGSKKLSKFFKDEKLSLVAKENSWVLCSDGKIVWVIGQRLDDRFKVTKTTRDIIKLTYTPINK